MLPIGSPKRTTDLFSSNESNVLLRKHVDTGRIEHQKLQVPAVKRFTDSHLMWDESASSESLRGHKDPPRMPCRNVDYAGFHVVLDESSSSESSRDYNDPPRMPHRNAEYFPEADEREQ